MDDLFFDDFSDEESRVFMQSFSEGVEPPLLLKQPNGEDGGLSKQKRAKRPRFSVGGEGEEERRRELNRRSAKKSRIRKKFKVEALEHRMKELEEENRKLQESLVDFQKRFLGGESIMGLVGENESKGYDDAVASITDRVVSPDEVTLLRSLMQLKTNFCLTDPNQVDDPIVYASPGFFAMTGYTSVEVLGRNGLNCRFLQGPGTDPKAVAKIRDAVERNMGVAVTMLNYKKDGTPFWNQVFVAPLMGPDSTVAHHVEVQREVHWPV